MTLEAGKEMDKRCVLNWLNEVYVTPSRAFDEYTEDELKMFAHDAIVLLKEQNDCENCAIAIEDRQPVVRCKDCKHWDKTTREEGNDCILGPWEDAVCDVFRGWDSYGDLGDIFIRKNGNWFCADGERR